MHFITSFITFIEQELLNFTERYFKSSGFVRAVEHTGTSSDKIKLPSMCKYKEVIMI